MSLQEKVIRLKLDAAAALRHAQFWQKAIAEHGETKATAFYKHLGLNHLEKKSIEWEGLTLSREPTASEKLCLKSVASAQEAGKASVVKILLEARTQLIEDGLKAVKKLAPADYHALVLTVSDDLRSELRDQLGKIFEKGQKLVAAELSSQKQTPKIAKPTDDDESELDDLTDLTDARVANDVQSRITAAIARFALLGLVGAALYQAVEKEMEAGSVSYIDRASQGVANKVLNFGRLREAKERKDEWSSVEYSALLDPNVCDPCASEDGESATNEDDLTPVPNPDCAGGDWCRCFHVYIFDEGQLAA